jgi:hypothetical protein
MPMASGMGTIWLNAGGDGMRHTVIRWEPAEPQQRGGNQTDRASLRYSSQDGRIEIEFVCGGLNTIKSRRR